MTFHTYVMFMRMVKRRRCCFVFSFLLVAVSFYKLLNHFSNKNLNKPYYQQSGYYFMEEMREMNRLQISMDDPNLIKLIRNYWIENPSKETYGLTDPVHDSLEGQAAFVDNRMGFKKKGFYVEYRALDGETRSNTLMLERIRNWNGLLIEADPDQYKVLKSKNRQAFTINACLSIYPYPVMMQFKQRFNRGKLVEKDKVYSNKYSVTEVQCFPLYSILLALNITHIDFFSLAIEGDELKVLQAIPFDKVYIDMISVEFKHDELGENFLKNYIESKGYSLVKIDHNNNGANDIIFKKINKTAEPTTTHILLD